MDQENKTEDKEKVGKETRRKKLTDKGMSYASETKGKRVQGIFRQLERDFDHINLVIATGVVNKSTIEDVRREYASWLFLYNTLFDVREDYRQLLKEPEIYHFEEECISQDKVLSNIKTAIEQFFVKHGSVQSQSEASLHPSRSSKRSGSCRTGLSPLASTISSAMLLERQRKAELQAKVKALKEKQKLNQAKLEIKMKEEELELRTQLEISEARSKVLDVYDNDQDDRNSARKYMTFDEGSIDQSLKSEMHRDHVIREHVPHMQKSEGANRNPRVSPFSSYAYEQPSDNMIISIVQQLRKPVPDIQKFNGNPLEFQKFMRQFRTKIISNSSSEDELMCYLEQFTEGEAHQVVKSFSYLDARSGYKAAMAELEERYGNQETIANALIKRAMCWPNIKADNAKSLDEYAVFLNECQNAVKSLYSVKVLEYPDNIRKLVMKLPFHCQEKWRGIVLQIRLSRSTVEFSDLVQFVRKEAQKAMDPMYGKEAMRPDDKKQVQKRVWANPSTVKVPTKLTFGTDLVKANKMGKDYNNQQPSRFDTNVQRPCDYCGNDGHLIDSCKKLASKPHIDRLNFLKSKGLCFRCFEQGHRSKECHKIVICQCCKGNHSTILHIDSQTNLKCLSACTGQASEDMETGDSSGECTLAVIPVKVTFKDTLKVISTYAFLDPGSTISFCSESLMNKLGCSGKSKKVEITIDTLGEPHTSFVHAISGLKVHDMDMKNTVVLPTVYSRSHIPVTSRHIPNDSDVAEWSHLGGIHLPSLESGVDLLIGANAPDAYSPFEVKVGPQGSPHATRTRLGWILWNVVRPSGEEGKQHFPSMRTDIVNVRNVEKISELNSLVRKSINFDFPESSIDDKAEMSQEDKKFLDKVNESVSLQEGHYHISLPFKCSNVQMPNNSVQALKRLDSLKRKFNKDQKFSDDYKTFMEDILAKGYAEKVPIEELEGQTGKVWYIPHHGIYHPRKISKIRVVFDCTASYQGVSLNNMLIQGPNSTNNLLGILLRFRQDSVAIMGDIESMFYRVKVPKEDRNYLRFYWWPRGDCDEKPEVYRMCVHLFGAISSSSCATFALQQTAEDNKERYISEVVSMVKDSFYVDDCLASVEDEERAVYLINEVSKLCMDGGFHLTKWVSNSKSVMKAIPTEERAKEVKELNLECESLPSERALGVFWFVDSDTLGFKIQSKEKTITRRGILSVVSSVYDPLGFVVPYVLIAKRLLQELCKKDLGWDEVIDEASLTIWLQWLKDLPRLDEIEVERCYKPKGFGKIASCQLHLFSDASEVGYGVVTYLRLSNEDNGVHCVLVMAKSRVAPLKKMTIPRMELTAATVAVRLGKLLTRELQYKIDETFFWTDSMSVLRYISNSTSRFKTFVANRLTTIHEGSEVKQWNYVNTKFNPADLASRGMTYDKFKHAHQWFEGPDFLWRLRVKWPISPDLSVTDEDPEVKNSVSCLVTGQSQNILDRLLNHYSSWLRLRKAVGWIILTIRELKRKMKARQLESEAAEDRSEKLSRAKPKLTVSVLKDAEVALARYVQGQHFMKEIEFLKGKESQIKKGRGVSKSSSLYKLDPFIEDGIIRVGGRLQRAEIPHDSKHPVVLPKTSPLSKLLIKDAHTAVGHMGKNAILTYLRQCYWILGAGAVIKSLVSKCVICKKYQSPTGQQQMADLPDDRLQPDKPPFSHVGMDFFGPFLVRRGRATVKRYGVVFSCLTMRAVHLELACSLDTDSCINAIRRFISRRGQPEVIRSDNGTNLSSSERELKEEILKLNQSKLHSSLLEKGIDWHFNPPTASHHGGIWERMIRSIRKVLNAVVQEQAIKLDDEGLSTLFCEVEIILNGRPITDVPYHPHDLNPLTPNHLLLLRSGQKMPPGTFCKDDVYSRRRWKQVQYLADIFWKRWVKEYLTLQQERQKWVTKKPNLEVGDIVLLADSSPRNSWSLGRVIEIMMDKKGSVRIVRVRTAFTELVRPINKLCVIVRGSK
ncbi:uncharacterized protein [Haliotis cracherodii]|uniref:uncharacterized protein n=1 Tax=Haliotis cracherodii TaxID=6455 RepID=UPI0039ED6577